MAKQRRKQIILPLWDRETFKLSFERKNVSLGRESFGEEWVKAKMKVIAKEYTHISVWIYSDLVTA